MRQFSNILMPGFMLGAALLGAWIQVGCGPPQPQTGKLPALPGIDIEAFAAATRSKLQAAYQAAQAKPNDARVAGNLGMFLQAHQQFGLAEQCYQRAWRLAPDSFRWRYYLGITEFRQGKNAQALQTFQAARGLRPDYGPLLLRLAEVHFSDGRLDQSRERYAEAAEADPESAEARYGLGRVLAAQGDSRQALPHLTKAVELAPDFGAAHYELAILYRDLQDEEKSRFHLQLYEQHKTAAPLPDDPLMGDISRLKDTARDHLNVGVEFEAAGQIEAAIREHERALEIDPKLSQAHINLLVLYGRTGQLDKATAHYQAAAKTNPNQADLHYNYGVLAFDQQRFQEARKAFETALEINPNYARAHNNMGQMLEMDRRFDEALGHYDKAVENQPNYRLAHFHRGRLLLMKSRAGEAIQAFELALEPEDDRTPTFLYALMAAHARAGNRDQAASYGRQALAVANKYQQSELAAKVEADLRKLAPGGEAR